MSIFPLQKGGEGGRHKKCKRSFMAGARSFSHAEWRVERDVHPLKWGKGVQTHDFPTLQPPST